MWLFVLSYCFFISSITPIQAQKQALIVGQSWRSNMDGIIRVMTITAVDYDEGTFAGQYGMLNSAVDDLRGTFDKDGGNLVGWTLSYHNGYMYGTQVWSGHFVDYQGTTQLAIESLSLRTAPGDNPPYIMSEYFVQGSKEYYVDTYKERLHFKMSGNFIFGSALYSDVHKRPNIMIEIVVPGQVWINAQKDVITIQSVNSGNGTFAGVFRRAKDKSSTKGYNIRGEIGKDGFTLGWSVIYVYEDPQKLDYRNSIVWCGHSVTNSKSEIYAMWLNTTEYKQLQNYIVTNVGVDRFVARNATVI